jgi:osmotically inducible protein OsmC
MIRMVPRKADAEWKGALKDGSGTVSLGSGAFTGPYTFASRFEQGDGTNPEELIAAAHAGCFSMALSHLLSEEGHAPTRVATSAAVHLKKDGEAFTISTVELRTSAAVPGVDADTFAAAAETAKETCPVSKALAGAEITLEATLEE